MRKLFVILAAFAATIAAKADEGMWTLYNLPNAVYEQMKGYGFALFVELLSAVLQDGSYGKSLTGKGENGEKVPFRLGHFFIAIDTDHFMGEDVCRKKAGDILREVRATKKAPGQDRIYTAGEKEYDIRLARKNGVPINESVQKEFIAIRDELNLNYHFPFED